MTNLAHYLCMFLPEYLPNERRASSHTIETYAYAYAYAFIAVRLSIKPLKFYLKVIIITFLPSLWFHI